MKLRELMDLWDVDAKIDETEVAQESLGSSQLHSKWRRLQAIEDLKLIRMQKALAQFQHEKKIFYTEGPSKEQVEKGWKLPARGKIMRADVHSYLEADIDLAQEAFKVAYQAEKVSFIKDVMNNIKGRGFQIKEYIAWLNFVRGEL